MNMRPTSIVAFALFVSVLWMSYLPSAKADYFFFKDVPCTDRGLQYDDSLDIKISQWIRNAKRILLGKKFNGQELSTVILTGPEIVVLFDDVGFKGNYSVLIHKPESKKLFSCFDLKPPLLRNVKSYAVFQDEKEFKIYTDKLLLE